MIDWIGFRLSRNEEPFLMLDPFVSYKNEIRNYLQGIEGENYEHDLPNE